MTKELVKYHNDLNSLSMRQWTSEEMDLFFTVISNIKDKGTERLRLNAEELKVLTGTETRNSYWFNMLDKFTKKAVSLYFSETLGSRNRVMTLFNYFEFNTDDRTLDVEVAPMFEYVVNKLTANFTVYELVEFTSLKSTYSKTMYRILKQWKSLGEKEFKIEQFRELLDIPKSYNTGMINTRIIKSIENELPPFFKGLKVKAIKKNTQGTPIIAYKFTWEKQVSSGKYIPDKYNKKSKTKSLADKDNRMNEQERKEFIERKLKRPLPINKPREIEEIKNVKGQIDATFYEKD